MNVSLSFQLQGFLISIACGVCLGLYYDFFRIFRTVFQSEKRTVFFQDLFYMLTAAFVTFLLALGVNYGEVRFYILAGEVIGWCLYFLTFGMVTIRVFHFASYVIHRFFINPIKKILSKLLHFLSNKIKLLLTNIKIKLVKWKKGLKPRNKIVYNHSKDKRKRKRKDKA